jgi:cytochrome c553
MGVRGLCVFAPIAFACCSFVAAAILPVEVAGEAGTVASVTVHIPPGLGSQARALWMQIHGLEYADMASVRINQGSWLALNNQTVAVAEPGRSYGGIGGGFATLKMTLPLAPGGVVEGSNTIQFRFNRSDGVVSGFRVLAFNFLTADGRVILPPGAFVEEDPNAWAPPLNDAQNISAGRNLWERAQLTANGLPQAPPIHAHCADCHARDGRDLKYFNFSNVSIVARSRFHGLSDLAGRQIASYIRSLPFPKPGRPWNPPYQPGPGLDTQPIASWPAGAGLKWVLDNDADALPFLATPAAFRPDSDLNPREVPIAFQLPDWNHWLPRVHPLDFREASFKSSAFSQLYESCDSPQTAAFFDKWTKSRATFLTPHLAPGSKKWTPDLAEAFYSAELWQLVKTWELVQRFNLESAGPEPRFWPNTVPAATAPAEAGIPDGPSGMGRSALTNEYFNNAWYELQVLLNGGNHRHHGRLPIDWLYFAGHMLDLQRLSETPEPGRLLVAVVKAMQSTDPAIGPDNYAEGWRPERNPDPRILVAKEWAPVFRNLPRDVKRALAESLLSAWLDKTFEYPPASYFALGAKPATYALPENLREISGGKVWEAAPQFEAAGVSPALIARLNAWGKSWTALAELFHY